MPVITKENVIPPLIENTFMQKAFLDGVHKTYQITPLDGYVLHDNTMDYENPETGLLVLGFRSSLASVPASYDFTENSREFYCVLANEMPEGSELFGGGNNEHETM